MLLPTAHALPHVPQLALSLAVLPHVSLQLVWPHTQLVSLQPVRNH
jgi:hypothetical protein